MSSSQNEGDAYSVQSQQESSMSSFVHIPSPNTTNTLVEDDETKSNRLAELQQLEQERLRKEKRRKIKGPKSPDLNQTETMLQDLGYATVPASRPRLGNKSEEGIVDPLVSFLRVLGAVFASKPASRQRPFIKPEDDDKSLISILSESSLNLKIVKEQDDLSNFLYESRQRPQSISHSLFIGFKVEKTNQFEEIQSHGFKCGSGFHLCRTIENAISFWQFRNQSLSSTEHLWIVLGVEAPPSELRAIDPGNHIWPLACINVSDIGSDQEGMDKLMSDLRRWTQSCATRHHSGIRGPSNDPIDIVDILIFLFFATFLVAWSITRP